MPSKWVLWLPSISYDSTWLRFSCISLVGLAVHIAFLQSVTISNDGATIMKLLDIVHPAAKTLVNISMSQDAEVVLRYTSPHITLG